jgi:type VII secretion-associated serine protease mycosin
MRRDRRVRRQRRAASPRRRLSLALAALSAAGTLASPAAPAGSSPAVSAPPRDPHTILVRFRPGVTADEQRSVAASADATLGEGVRGTDYTLIRTAHAADPRVLQTLEEDSRVADAELNYVRRAAAVPNDPEYARQQPYLDRVRLPQAWELAGADADALVAVVDTGVDAAQPDLAGRVLTGRDFINDDGDAYDDQWHGTWVAAIIAANTNNGVGIAGASPRARILPVKVLDAYGNGTDADIAAGITWAADHNADVINLSLGGPRENAVIRQAVEYALRRDVVVVASAGNEGSDAPQYPAAYPGVVAVAATDANGEPASFSGRGPWIDIAAPGTNITSARSRSSYETMSGTSYAAPFVSGVAALVHALDPALPASQIVSRLLATAEDAGPAGFDGRYGHGILDAVAAAGVPARAPDEQAPQPPAAVIDPSPTSVAQSPATVVPPRSAVPAPSVPASPPPAAVEARDDAQRPARIVLTVGQSRSPVSRAGIARVWIACTGSVLCAGRVTLRQASHVLGRATFSLVAGRGAAVAVRLRPSARRQLAARGTLITRAVATSAAGSVLAANVVRLELARRV